MPYSEKQVAGKITRTTEGWEEHTEDAKFAEMTLDQFKAKVKPSLDCREKIASLRRQLEPAIKKRQECEVASTDICAKVLNAMRGDIEYGEDSALYKTLGYVPKSERKSGLRRTVALKKGLSRVVSVRSDERVEINTVTRSLFLEGTPCPASPFSIPHLLRVRCSRSIAGQFPLY